jgi:isopentenyl-diphosphate delta-isomerase
MVNKNTSIMYDELLDLVNEDDQVIGQKYRSEIWKENINNFRTVNVFLINDKQEIWIPRRTAHKKLFPLCLDSSAGGHVIAGESYDQAFERELKEELNIDLSNVLYRLIAKLTPAEHKVSSFMHVYIVQSNGTPQYNLNDFVEYSWIDIITLQQKIQSGERTKSDLPTLVNTLQKWLHTKS